MGFIIDSAVTSFSEADYLNLLFNADEYVCFAENKYGIGVYEADCGLVTTFCGLNPFRPGTTRLDINCSAFRNFLIEIDDMPLEDQLPYVDGQRVPYSTIVYSGKKSYHFVICLADSVSVDEYRRIARWIHKALPRIDHKTTNPSRLTRFPNVIRADTDKYQTLIYAGRRITLTELKDWLSSVTAEPVSTSSQVRAYRPCLDPSIRGRLRKSTLKLINGDWVVGDRNINVFKAACDFAQQNYTLEECVETLSSNFPFSDGEDGFSEEEFVRTVRSAYKRVDEKFNSSRVNL